MPKNSKKKQNLPHYMLEKQPMDLVEIQQKEYKENKENKEIQQPDVMIIPKFRLGIDKNNNPLVTIDNYLHFMTAKQFDAFAWAVLNVARKINPEVNYSHDNKKSPE